jgi:signal transduction histidine kinase/FixJ family two-component response regulator
MTPKILWVDDDPNILQAAERLLRTQSWEFIGTTDVSRAKDLLGQSPFTVLVADQIMSESSGVDLLEFAKKYSPYTTRILLTGKVDTAVLGEAVNRGAVFRFVAKPWENSELLSDVAASIEHHHLRSVQANLLKEVSRQNKLLEELTSGLEQLVVERTESSEFSKNEVEAKLSRMRQLVRFIKDLALSTSIDELMTLIKKETKAFHGIRSVMLGYFTVERKPVIVYFQGKQVVEKRPRENWTDTTRLRINELEDRIYLANEFGRPFVKTLAIPLKRRASDKLNQSEVTATLFFEHTFVDERIDDFLNFIGEFVQPLSIALDRILLEYNLKYTSFQWESTFDGIKDPIAIVDMNYQVVRANRHFNGRSYAHHCHQVFMQSEDVCAGCPVARALKTGQPQHGQIRHGQRTFDVLSYPIRPEGDSVSSNVINHYVDVTSARELQGRVIQNEKMVAIGSLAGNIAHELNNPLTGIRSLAQILIRELADQNKYDQVRQDLQEVEQAAERSQKIIENLLDFSKGGSDERQIKVSLNEIFARTLPMLKTAMRDHRTEIYLSEESTLVKAEPHLLQQVVFNLINNACQAMAGPGTIKIISRVVKESDQEWVELDVADTGSGISPEIRESIFEPFFTTKEEGRGTGLGLSMSQNVIQKFGGLISLQSEVGKGSCFTARLPRVSL